MLIARKRKPYLRSDKRQPRAKTSRQADRCVSPRSLFLAASIRMPSLAMLDPSASLELFCSSSDVNQPEVSPTLGCRMIALDRGRSLGRYGIGRLPSTRLSVTRFRTVPDRSCSQSWSRFRTSRPHSSSYHRWDGSLSLDSLCIEVDYVALSGSSSSATCMYEHSNPVHR